MINWALYLLLLLIVFRGLTGRTHELLMAAIFFVPMTQVMPTPVGTIGASANIIVLALLLRWVMVKNERGELPPVPVQKLILGMMLFILLAAIHRYHLEVIQGNVYLSQMDKVYRETKEFMMAYIAYFLVFRLVDSRQALQKMWWAFLLCLGGECLLAIYERLQGMGRATAHLDEANRAGAYFAGCVVVFLGMTLVLKGRWQQASIVALIIGFGAVFASLSRGAMLAAAIGFLVVLAMFFRFVHEGASKLAVGVLIVIMALNASLLLPQRVIDRVMFTFGGGSATSAEMGLNENVDQSSGERLAIWEAAVVIIKKQPLGIGFHTFPTVVRQYVPLAKVAHNIYLTVGAEMGVAALAWLLILNGTVWVLSYRAFRQARSPEEMAIGLALMGFWTALCVSVVFFNAFFAFNLSGQIWILFAARMKIMAMDRQEEEERLNLRRRSRRNQRTTSAREPGQAVADGR